MALDPAPLHLDGAFGAPENGQAVWLRTADGVRIRAAVWPGGGRGTAVIFQGRTEFIEKYAEPIARFSADGFTVAAVDWRGQGLSDRPLPDPRKGHVGDFAEYQRDVDAFLAHLAAVEAPKPWVLVGHSMGGAISARMLMRQDPALGGDLAGAAPFVAAVLSAPMLALHGRFGSGLVPRALSGAALLFGLRRAYAPGCDRRNAADLGFQDNVLTTDEARFGWHARLTHAHGETLALGGPTWGWLNAALAEIAALRPASTPVLIAIGDADTVVSLPATQRYAAEAPNARRLVLSGARHEPFLETDAIQDRLWTEIASFLKQSGV